MIYAKLGLLMFCINKRKSNIPMIVIWIFYQILMKNLNKIIISIRVALGYKKNALVLN